MKKLRLIVALLVSTTALFAASTPKIESGMKEAKLLKLMGPPDKKMVFPSGGDADRGPAIIYTWADLRVMVRNGEVDSTKAVDPKVREDARRIEEEKRVAAEILKKRKIEMLENDIRRMELWLAPGSDRVNLSEEEKATVRITIEKARLEMETIRKS